MGREASCRVRWRRRAARGMARLEEKSLQFRGELRLDIPFDRISSCVAERGELRVEWPDGPARFELGSDAEPWALAIRYPRPLVDKLGVKPGMRVAWLGLDEPELERQVAARAGELARVRARRGSDLVLVAAASRAQLARLPTLRRAIEPDGAIWVVWPKGRPALREDDVRAAARDAGLVDVKVVSVSERSSGLKLVIPRAQRRR